MNDLTCAIILDFIIIIGRDIKKKTKLTKNTELSYNTLSELVTDIDNLTYLGNSILNNLEFNIVDNDERW